jgi:hypothetical protein
LALSSGILLGFLAVISVPTIKLFDRVFFEWLGWLPPYAPIFDEGILRTLVGILKGLGAFGDAIHWLLIQLPTQLGIMPVLDQYPEMVLAFIGIVVGYWRCEELSTHLNDRFLAEFNDEVLAPIKKPRSFDPLRGSIADVDATPMGWVRPEPSDGRDPWAELETFVWRHTGSGDVSSSDSERRMFGWTIMVGPSGCGKSRMAVEFARDLAKRHVLGSTASKNTQQMSKFRAWRRLQLSRRPPELGRVLISALADVGMAVIPVSRGKEAFHGRQSLRSDGLRVVGDQGSAAA